jgi:hypothetical protein
VSLDRDQNGIPDECGGPKATPFHRGDADADGIATIGDGVFVFNFLFLGGRAPTCKETIDTNNDGALDISDGIGILNFLFLGGRPPEPPGPPGLPCGPDRDAAGSPGDLGCELYDPC